MDLLLEWARALLHLVQAHNYLALYALLAVEEGGLPLPLPGDTVVAYTGYLATKGAMIWWLILLVAVAASVTGSLPLYWLARSRGRPALLRYGRYLHLTPARERRIEGWLRRNAGAAVFVGRLVPGMRVGTTAIAGVFEIPFWVFVTYLTLSAVAWWGFWLWLGSAVGKRLAPIMEFSPLNFVAAAGIIVLIGGTFLYLRHLAAADHPPTPSPTAGAPDDGKVLEASGVGAPVAGE